MTIDYDVVIVGGSLTGRYAAAYAAQLEAKIALVEPNLQPQLNYPLGESLAKSQIGTWSDSLVYAHGVAANLSQLHSLDNLAALGVDVIIGKSEFLSSSKLALAVNNRKLFGRTYLLVDGADSQLPPIPGLETTGYLTLNNIWESLTSGNLPKSWVIMGSTPQSIEIAQVLARYGCDVTLIVKSSQIMPAIEPEISQMLIAQLEIDGVQILTSITVTQVEQRDGKKLVYLGEQAIATDEILVVTGQRPNLDALNLSAVGVTGFRHRLLVNHKLQTTNHRIYACGNIIGGYNLVNIAKYEAEIAVKNCLFLPIYTVNYRSVPWVISSQPLLAQVGLTETQAKSKYPQNQVLAFKQYFSGLAAAQISSKITGICKLVVLENGDILGASIFGVEAEELINLIALAISQNIPIQKIANLAPIYPSFMEILGKTAQEYHRNRLQRNQALQDFLANFYYLRRVWNL